MVDLEKEYEIDRVEITTRGDEGQSVGCVKSDHTAAS